MRVLFCSTEIYPYVKTGGLGDVTAALPPALIKAGVDLRLLLPGFEKILTNLKNVETLVEFPVYFGAEGVRLLKGTLPGNLTTYILDAPAFWDRTGAYVDQDGKDWPDNHYRFAAFCRAATDLAEYDRDWQPDIIHGSDWQCGLIPPYIKLKSGPHPKTVMTIHNIAYQGLFPPTILPSIGIPGEMYTIAGAEFYDKVGYLKAGLAYADHITTVSPTYAREIQDTDQGCGLQDFLKTKSDRITGIINGIDTDVWNPKTDPDVPQKYDAKHLKDRAKNKKSLLEKFNLSPETKGPLFAVISRLGYQKGFDLLLSAMPHLLELGGNLILLGSGDKPLEDAFTHLSRTYPDRVSVRIGYDETLAHHMQAGADVIVMPSRSEPCGLVQLYAMRYGALPFVRKTGGLADTVIDIQNAGATGFAFEGDDAFSLEAHLPLIFEAYNTPGFWAELQKNAMTRDYGWDDPARQYVRLYERVLKEA